MDSLAHQTVENKKERKKLLTRLFFETYGQGEETTDNDQLRVNYESKQQQQLRYVRCSAQPSRKASCSFLITDQWLPLLSDRSLPAEPSQSNSIYKREFFSSLWGSVGADRIRDKLSGSARQ